VQALWIRFAIGAAIRFYTAGAHTGAAVVVSVAPVMFRTTGTRLSRFSGRQASREFRMRKPGKRVKFRPVVVPTTPCAMTRAAKRASRPPIGASLPLRSRQRIEISDITLLRLQNQQLLSHSFKCPTDVVRWFGAFQSQDLASSLYAIGLRTPGSTEPLVERGLSDKTIVRTWPMRRTIHCMPAEDARWMVRLLAPRQNARMASYYRKAGITHGDLERAGKVIHSALAGGKQLTRSELYRELNAAGIATSASAGAMRGLHILVHCAQAGLTCMASRSGKQQTFALLDEWAPPGRDLSGREALAELAKRHW
jgi:hypothetical protein